MDHNATIDNDLFVEADAVAQELLDAWCARRNIEPKTGLDRARAISRLFETKSDILLSAARERLNARATAHRDWLKKIIPTKPNINLTDLTDLI
jgi:hypothetical protein